MATKLSRIPTKSPNSSSGMLPWLGLSFVVILLDQISKITITKLFHEDETSHITSFFDLVLVYNKGASFSFLANASGWQRYFFIALAAVVAIVILQQLKRNAGKALFCWSLALILGGLIGNVIDRIVHGQVVDFLSFHWGSARFPAFNVADGAITLGVILFIIDELRRVNK